MWLNDAETNLIAKLGFDKTICEAMKEAARKQLDPLTSFGYIRTKAPVGISIAVKDGEEAERLMNAVREDLAQGGYRAFWSNRRDESGLVDTDQVAVLHTTDRYAIVRLAQTDGSNYSVFTSDILDRLAAWQQISTFDVVGASNDWVAIEFSRLPDRICAFADEVYAFCPDTVDQGVGLTREKDNPALFESARHLCPEVVTKPEKMSPVAFASMPEHLRAALTKLAATSTPSDMGVRLLAHSIQTRRYLFLWWD